MLTTKQAFSEAFYHKDHVILGRRMLPFCLRHWLILDASQSPFLTGGKVGISDIKEAVIICSTETNEQWRSAATTPGWLWKRWHRSTSKSDPVDSHWRFINYLADYMPRFPWSDKDSSTSNIRCPSFFVASSRLLEVYGPEKIMRAPLGELLAWSLARREATQGEAENLLSDIEVDMVNKSETPNA